MDELIDENEMVLSDFELSQKKIEFLQNYRKILIELSVNCVCNQNKPLIDSIESLETQYNQLFTQLNDGKSGENIVTTIETSEEIVESEVVLEEDIKTSETVIEISVDNEEVILLDDNNKTEEVVETTVETSECNDDVVILEDIIPSNGSKINKKSEIQSESGVKSLNIYTKPTTSCKSSSNEPIVFNLLSLPSLPSLPLKSNTRSCKSKRAVRCVRSNKQSQKSTSLPKRSFFLKCGQQVKSLLLPINSPQSSPLVTAPITTPLTTTAYIPILSLSAPPVVPTPAPKTSFLLKFPADRLKNKPIEQNLNKFEFQYKPILNKSQKKFEFKTEINGGKGIKYFSYDSIDELNDTEKAHLVRQGVIISFKMIDDLCEVYLRKEVSKSGEEVSQVIYKCLECGKECKRSDYMRRHIRHVHKPTNTRITIKKLRQLVESGNCVVIADEEGRKFSEIHLEFTNQENGRTELGPIQGYKCDYFDCNFVCLQMKTLSPHLITHEMGKTYECDICHNLYGNKDVLNHHKINIHNIKNQPPLKCQSEGCDYQTYNAGNMHTHFNRHHKTAVPIKCTEIGCDKILKNDLCLSQHIKFVHTNIKTYLCQWPACGKLYKHKPSFRIHMAGHTGTDLSIECDLCGKKFNHKRAVVSHQIIKHNIKNKPFLKCPHCPYKTTVNTSLEKHSIVHKNRRPFVCEESGCDKRFKSKESLRHHLRAHSDVRPFPCEWPGCDLAFKLNQVRENHMKSVHFYDNTRFGCNYCDTTYKYKGDLQRHIRREHSIKKSSVNRGSKSKAN